jgi:hypothetical protein
LVFDDAPGIGLWMPLFIGNWNHKNSERTGLEPSDLMPKGRLGYSSAVPLDPAAPTGWYSVFFGTDLAHLRQQTAVYDRWSVTLPPPARRNGKVVGTIGIDFKLQPSQTDATILQRTGELLKELERRLQQ